ncbi:MAG: ABC transporter permease, partial [Bacteroidales bacterium]
MRHVWSDIRYGVRMLARYPTLSVVSILTFGLGLGLATSVFSIVNGALYKGLPFQDADRIVIVAGTNAERNVQRGPVGVHDFVVLRERQTTFESFGAFDNLAINLSGDGNPPQRFESGAVTTTVLRSLKVEPVLGRLFRDGEDVAGADAVMVIGYRLWQERFAGSPS